MAIFKSNILAQVSGSLNGITFSHNAGGAYIRNRSIPINPGTDRQDQVRTTMTALATAWRDVLTQLQRDEWNAFGAATQVINKLGDTINLSGIAAYTRTNMFRVSTLGLAPLNDPPASGGTDPVPSFDSVVVTNATGIVSMEVNLNNLTLGDYSIAYYLSGALSPGKKFYRGPWLERGTEPIAGTNPAVLISSTLDGNVYAESAALAARLTLYRASSGLPVWSVFTDALLIPAVT